MGMMKRLLLFFALSAALASAAGIDTVRNVYLLPMNRGFDQYLANRLTSEHVFQVVTDPARADAFFTDRIGEQFEQKMTELLPEPEEAKPAKDDAQTKADAKPAKEESAEGKHKADEMGGDTGFVDTTNKLAKPMSTLSRSKGTIFLVDAKSRQVIWSAYEVPKDFSSKQLDHSAGTLVQRIRQELKKQPVTPAAPEPVPGTTPRGAP